MTGWRCAAILGNADAIADLLAAEDEHRLGPVRGGPAGRRRGARRARSEPLEEMNAIYARRRDLVVGALREIGVEVAAPKGTIYVWAPVPEGHTSTSFAELVLEEAAVVDLARLDVRAERRGLLPDLADDARRAHRRGGRADARAPRPERVERAGAGRGRASSSRAATATAARSRIGDRVRGLGHRAGLARRQLRPRPGGSGAALLRDHRRRARASSAPSAADVVRTRDVRHRRRDRRRGRPRSTGSSSATAEPAVDDGRRRRPARPALAGRDRGRGPAAHGLLGLANNARPRAGAALALGVRGRFKPLLTLTDSDNR